jgi:hypothetical protein
MASRLLELKQKGYSLNEVLGVIQENTQSSQEKETVLTALAIEIYLDSTPNHENSAHNVSAGKCRSPK